MKPEAADERLANLVRMTPQAFEAVFDRARPLPTGQTAIRFAALGEGNARAQDRFALAFALARRDGWIGKLIEQYLTTGGALDDPVFLAEAQEQGLIEEHSTLQAVLDVRRGFAEAGLEAAHINRTLRQVCRIDIDGRPAGTGFLVFPNMVATAFHVIRPLVTVNAATVSAQPGSAIRLRVVFDDIDVLRNGFSARMPGTVVPIDSNWLAWASPCHELELDGRLPNDPDELAGKLDFALLRLAGVARVGVPPVAIDPARAVEPREPITIFQHPGGRSLSIDRANVIDRIGAWRFKHSVNSEGGSSGGPCFDRSFQVIGVHQAGTTAANGGNRAVPMLPVVQQLAQVTNDTDPPVAPIAELSEGRPGHPVLGRLETQDWVWRELRQPKQPVLAVWGNPGEGKSFTFDILRTLLPRDGHDLVLLRAGDIQAMSPDEFAGHLLERLGYPPLAPVQNNENTEPARFLMETHLPTLLAGLDAGRRAHPHTDGPAPQRGIWIAIDDIEKAIIGQSTELSAYLFSFYASAASRPWLRFLLLGYDGKLPESIDPLARRITIAPPADEDIAYYIKAKLPADAVGDGDFAIRAVIALLRHRSRDVPARQQIAEMQQQLTVVAEGWAGQSRP